MIKGVRFQQTRTATTMRREAAERRGSNLNTTGAGPIRLLLVDCQRAVRRGIRMRLALEPDLEVVGETGDAAEAVSLASALRPDVILLDVELPGVRGVAATERLRSVAPQTAMVVFTLRDDAATQEQVRAAGAAFVAKHETEETLLAAIRAVAAERSRRNHA